MGLKSAFFMGYESPGPKQVCGPGLTMQVHGLVVKWTKKGACEVECRGAVKALARGKYEIKGVNSWLLCVYPKGVLFSRMRALKRTRRLTRRCTIRCCFLPKACSTAFRMGVIALLLIRVELSSQHSRLCGFSGCLWSYSRV